MLLLLLLLPFAAESNPRISARPNISSPKWADIVFSNTGDRITGFLGILGHTGRRGVTWKREFGGKWPRMWPTKVPSLLPVLLSSEHLELSAVLAFSSPPLAAKARRFFSCLLVWKFLMKLRVDWEIILPSSSTGKVCKCSNITKGREFSNQQSTYTVYVRQRL